MKNVVKKAIMLSTIAMLGLTSNAMAQSRNSGSPSVSPTICYQGANGYQCSSIQVGPGTPGWVYSPPRPGPQPGSNAHNAAMAGYSYGTSALGGGAGALIGGAPGAVIGGGAGAVIGGATQNRFGALVSRGTPATARLKCVRGLYISNCVR